MRGVTGPRMTILAVQTICIRHRRLIHERTIPNLTANRIGILVQDTKYAALGVCGLVDHASVIVDTAHRLRGRCGVPVAGVEDDDVAVAFEGSGTGFEKLGGGEGWGFWRG